MAIPAPLQINVKLIAPFVQAVRAVFTTMVKLPTTIRRPFIKSDHTASHAIAAIIGFSGDVIGTVVVGMSEATAIKLASSFAGVPTVDRADAIGEIAGMIAGGAKKDLGRAVEMTVPRVVSGAGEMPAGLQGVPWIVIPVSTPMGEFTVELNIRRMDAWNEERAA